MTEKDLIKKIQELRRIQPRKDWAVLTKNRILGEEKSRFSQITEGIEILRDFGFSRKLSLRTIGISSGILILLIVGIFFLAESSLPGEPFHSLEKLAENGQKILQDEPEFHLNIAEKRAQELKKIAEANQTEKLSPAIKEYQDSLKKLSESLAKNSKQPEQTLHIAKKVNKLKEETKEIEKVLGIKIEEIKEIENGTIVLLEKDIKETEYKMARLAERLLQDLEKSSLTEAQKELIIEAKKCLAKGDYENSLIKILKASQ